MTKEKKLIYNNFSNALFTRNRGIVIWDTWQVISSCGFLLYFNLKRVGVENSNAGPNLKKNVSTKKH